MSFKFELTKEGEYKINGKEVDQRLFYKVIEQTARALNPKGISQEFIPEFLMYLSDREHDLYEAIEDYLEEKNIPVGLKDTMIQNLKIHIQEGIEEFTDGLAEIETITISPKEEYTIDITSEEYLTHISIAQLKSDSLKRIKYKDYMLKVKLSQEEVEFDLSKVIKKNAQLEKESVKYINGVLSLTLRQVFNPLH